MKAELNIDTQELINEITKGVIDAIMPHINSNGSKDTIYNVPDLAKYLGVKKTWIYGHMNELPHFKIGKHSRFRKSEIDEYLISKEEIINNKIINRPQKKQNPVRRLLEDLPSNHCE